MLWSSAAKTKLKCYVDLLVGSFDNIVLCGPAIVVMSDVSTPDWGTVCNNRRTGGHWLSDERQQHIKFLEENSASFALQSFHSDLCGKRVRKMNWQHHGCGMYQSHGYQPCRILYKDKGTGLKMVLCWQTKVSMANLHGHAEQGSEPTSYNLLIIPSYPARNTLFLRTNWNWWHMQNPAMTLEERVLLGYNFPIYELIDPSNSVRYLPRSQIENVRKI